MSNDPHPQDSPLGVAFAAGAYTLWGLIPLYWRLLHHVPPVELTLHRVFWCAIVVALAVLWRDRFKAVRVAIKNPRLIATLALTSLLISVNWGIYIWSVASDQLVEASLGYYINPLVSIALGVILLDERMTRLRLAAIALAAVAVAIQTLTIGHFPWIALTLAVSFGFYGYLRKTAAIESLDGLLIETAILFPVAAGLIAVWMAEGTGAFASVSLATDAMLVFAGVMTAVPLALFSAGARRIRLSTLGFLQYLSPSLTLALATVWFGEPFTHVHAVTFGLIWFALALISFEGLRARRAETAEA